jgi:hypothetical protein
MNSFEHQKLDGLLATKMADYLIAQTPSVEYLERNALISHLYSFLRNAGDCPVWAHAFGWPPQEHEEK